MFLSTLFTRAWKTAGVLVNVFSIHRPLGFYAAMPLLFYASLQSNLVKNFVFWSNSKAEAKGYFLAPYTLCTGEGICLSL